MEGDEVVRSTSPVGTGQPHHQPLEFTQEGLLNLVCQQIELMFSKGYTDDATKQTRIKEATDRFMDSMLGPGRKSEPEPTAHARGESSVRGGSYACVL